MNKFDKLVVLIEKTGKVFKALTSLVLEIGTFLAVIMMVWNSLK